MKSVLISIRPKWCELIASGEKTIEVRKTKPKIETPFKCYIYCTKSDDMFWVLNTISRREYGISVVCANLDGAEGAIRGDGKVIGEFVCKKFTYIEAGYDTNGRKHLYNTAFIEHCMCISDNELHEYLYKNRENCGGWAWHISDLVIYDTPKELSEFRKPCKPGCNAICNIGCPNVLERSPKTWCYCVKMGVVLD